jgi:hypothetical protein
MLKMKREKRDAAKDLQIAALAARGEPKTVEKTLKELQK